MSKAKLNILFINQRQSEYGQSLLYHGLTKLGHHVVPFYWSSFHFEQLQPCEQKCSDKNSPCQDFSAIIGCTNHPAHLDLPHPTAMEIVDMLWYNWDLIVTNNGYGNEELHRHFRRQGIPIAALDLGDSAQSAWDAWCGVIGGPPDFFFRREYYSGQQGFPLSYSFYAERAVDREALETRPGLVVSSLYRPTNASRKQTSEEIKKTFPNSFVGQKPHSEYLATIANSQFSVALPGAGQDTLRAWEIASQGSVLCKPTQSITINNDFVGGESCIVFKNVEDLVSQIKYYLNNRKEYDELRKRCFNHFIKHHTTEARAAELLERCGFS